MAVFSFDSHLKLWLDFTRDRDAAAQAIARALRSGGEPGLVGHAEEPGGGRSGGLRCAPTPRLRF